MKVKLRKRSPHGLGSHLDLLHSKQNPSPPSVIACLKANFWSVGNATANPSSLKRKLHKKTSRKPNLSSYRGRAYPRGRIRLSYTLPTGWWARSAPQACWLVLGCLVYLLYFAVCFIYCQMARLEGDWCGTVGLPDRRLAGVISSGGASECFRARSNLLFRFATDWPYY